MGGLCCGGTCANKGLDGAETAPIRRINSMRFVFINIIYEIN
jgi:hypothetical protein